MLRCPGQDERFWKPDDIFEVKCPNCGKSIEFFKDEPKLKCRKCGQEVLNPKIDLGCAEWCQYAQHCADVLKSGANPIPLEKPTAEGKTPAKKSQRRRKENGSPTAK